ncbi:hypothetical protein ACQUSY_00525 [Microbacterium sp. YY-03]|uniref:hypothetical protein n=1 Tax=Microbacterium sp. YY-03 TaxID=3421636 RepID=UPI003D182C56
MSSTLLTRDLRAIRRVAPPDAPCEATLAIAENGSCLLVDSDNAVPAAAMRFVGAEHVWAPLDVFRRTDGHDVLMPRVVEPLEMFLERRRGSEMRAGEIVTLGCSILRGVTELRADDTAEPVAGRWWVTEAGRPVFVVATGDSVAGGAARMFEMLTEHAADRDLNRVLTDATGLVAVADAIELTDIERQLVHIAAPQPVELTTLGSQLQTTRASADALVPKRRAAFDRLLEPGGAREVSQPAAVVRGAVARLLGVVKERRESRRKPVPQSRKHRASKKRMWLVAVALGLTVVVVGTMWPDSNGPEGVTKVSAPTTEAPPQPGDADTEVPAPPAAEPAAASPAAPEVPEPAPPAPATIVAKEGQPEITAVATALLIAVASCEGEPTCAGLLSDATSAALVPHAGVVELIDDYGGIAVFSVTPPDASAVTVVIENRGDQWLIREVYEKK